jgi:2-haloacid dehalogenase
MLAGIKALTFDTGGTILDWHTGLCQAFKQAGAHQGLSADWSRITNEYRRRSLKMMVSAVNPSFNIEDVHRARRGDRGIRAHHVDGRGP